MYIKVKIEIELDENTPLLLQTALAECLAARIPKAAMLGSKDSLSVVINGKVYVHGDEH